MRIALATCSAMPGLYPDDRHLLAALRASGVETEPVVWEDRFVAWEAFDLCVVRSTWDYAYRLPDFLAWTERVAAAIPLVNPVSLLRWNAHKSYLLDLAQRGVAVVPTILLPAGSAATLADVAAEHGWAGVVIKPAVGASGRLAMACPAGNLSAGQRHLDRILPHEDMLVQPLVPDIGRAGELSMVFVGSACTHAVRKRGAEGDFRVHDDYGGIVEPADPAPEELAVAEAAVRSVGEPLCYARVDLVRTADDEPVVMEFELIEPELFFRFSDVAVRTLRDAVIALAHPHPG